MSTAPRDPLLWLDDAPATGEENMRRDAHLLDQCAAGRIAGAVRLYAFAPPCLSLGRMQPLADVDVEACARDGVDVVRRPSGGRAVLHDEEVTYAVVCRTDDPDFGGDVLDSCARIHAAVAAGLATLGIETRAHAAAGAVRAAARDAAGVADCFASPSQHELVDVRGRKLVGSAQARLGMALLQHGSVPLRPPRAGRYLLGDGSAVGTGVRPLAGRDVTVGELRAALAEGFRTILRGRLPDHSMLC